MKRFDNTEVAFRIKSDRELERAYLLFRMISHPSMVRIGSSLVKFGLSLRLPIKGLIRSTVYDHFCGGESIQDCEPVMRKMYSNGVSSILDYSIEGQDNENDFVHAEAVAVETIPFAAQHNEIPFTVFKPTGMARFELLAKVQAKEELSEKEQEEWDRVKVRFDRIAQEAQKHDLPLMIDAEETWIQDVCDELVIDLMRKYNKEKVIIYNTLQMYRHDRIAHLEWQIKDAREKGYHVGLKIVRGAYMEKERERADEKGYQDPIQPNKAATDRDFDLASKMIVDNIDIMCLCCGTHNEESADFLARYMGEKGLAKDDIRIYFSQLYGMSDHISYNLASEGYNVVKYLPYGPVRKVMPYLFRRAEENTSVEGQTGRELNLLTKERKRRKEVRS
jgi:proline dehydrogenase